MALENIFRKARVALVVGACALSVEAASVVRAQTRMIAGSPMGETLRVATAERIVLHGVRFRAQSDKIDKRSIPILDYAVQILKEHSESLIYVKIRCIRDTSQGRTDLNSELTNRQTRAVASYFEQEGISANKLILLDSRNAPDSSEKDRNNAQSPEYSSEVVQLELASGLD
jgi:outer membrane protein OmpA-like peptidoglycan-associated protein